MKSCIDAFDALRSQSPPSSYSHPQPSSAPASSSKRKLVPESFDSSTGSSAPKRRQSGPDSITVARIIQPKPPSGAIGSPQPFSPPLPGQSVPQKKRGRPSKADIERRNRDALRKGEILAAPSEPAPKRAPVKMTIAEMGGVESSMQREREILPSPRMFPPILPMGENPSPRHSIAPMLSTPISEQRSPSRIEGEPEGDPGDGRKRRPRSTSRPTKPGESSFQVTQSAPHAPPYYDPVRSHTTPAPPQATADRSPRRMESESLSSQPYTPQTEYAAPSNADRSDI